MNRARRVVPQAFTLIEMLTVIAIIAILAGLLLPAIQAARQRARVAQAKHDISQLQTALQSYKLDFDAYPPDSPENIGHPQPFPDNLSPNECMIWFLTHQYSKAATAAGHPDTWVGGTMWPAEIVVPPSPPPARKPAAQVLGEVFSRVGGVGPYFELKPDRKQDYNDNGFPEYVDPWGRPYLYRAYERKWDVPAITKVGNQIHYKVTADTFLGDVPSGSGKIRVTGLTGAASVNNGTFDVTGGGTDWIEVTNPSGVASAGGGFIQFLLHNTHGCDLYSLGPNGLTRSKVRPKDTAGTTIEWSPNSFDSWNTAWGTGADGNDVQNGNTGIDSDKDRDDINNWQ